MSGVAFPILFLINHVTFLFLKYFFIYLEKGGLKSQHKMAAKIAVITGATSGIGTEIARRLARENFKGE